MRYNYSIFDVSKEFFKNKQLIQSYIKGDTTEGYAKDGVAIMGMSVGIFVLYFLMMVAVWVWALIVLIKFWSTLPMMVKVIGVLGLILPGWVVGPLITLIVVHLSKDMPDFSLGSFTQ